MQNNQPDPLQQSFTPSSYRQPYSRPFPLPTPNPNWQQSFPAQPPPPPQRRKGHTVPLWLFVIVLIWALVTSAVLGMHNVGTNNALPTKVDNPNTNSNAVPTANTVPQTTPASTSIVTWRTTHNHGSGNLKTDPITVAGSTWQMNWTCDPNSFDGIQWNFSVSLYNTDGTFWILMSSMKSVRLA